MIREVPKEKSNVEKVKDVNMSFINQGTGADKVQIEEIKELCNQGKIRWSMHGLERMQERDISRTDVKKCLTNGEIIEDYPNDYPHPSCLVFGNTVNNNVIHVVVGNDGEYIYIITAYFPNTTKFENDLKTRKER